MPWRTSRGAIPRSVAPRRGAQFCLASCRLDADRPIKRRGRAGHRRNRRAAGRDGRRDSGSRDPRFGRPHRRHAGRGGGDVRRMAVLGPCRPTRSLGVRRQADQSDTDERTPGRRRGRPENDHRRRGRRNEPTVSDRAGRLLGRRIEGRSRSPRESARPSRVGRRSGSGHHGPRPNLRSKPAEVAFERLEELLAAGPLGGPRSGGQPRAWSEALLDMVEAGASPEARSTRRTARGCSPAANPRSAARGSPVREGRRLAERGPRRLPPDTHAIGRRGGRPSGLPASLASCHKVGESGARWAPTSPRSRTDRPRRS